MGTRGLRLARMMITFVGLGFGFAAAYYGLPLAEELFGADLSGTDRTSIVTLITVLGGLLGYAGSVPLLNSILRGTSWAENRLQKMPMQDMLSGVAGLIIGLIIANLLADSLARIPWAGTLLPTAGSVVLGYLGLSVGIAKREEIGALVSLIAPRRLERQPRESAVDRGVKVLDTSAIIDGRIADVCRAGFLEGPLVVPGFVLEELRHIADASDPLRRNRGRRGLDILDEMQKIPGASVQVLDRDPGGNVDVDTKLVRLAKTMKARVVTNDYNLNRVAHLHGVKVLNVNELANALKPAVLPGEEMNVQIIRDGKEQGQGVGYLEDGTMIVVEGGRKHIGEQIPVQVTSVYQTGAGRMIFARPKANSDRNVKAVE
ncbi:MAG: TRAM domain-containing protein [Bacillota bacterium]|nr:TRAM domain-containing protein [Bacillota bacterium]